MMTLDEMIKWHDEMAQSFDDILKDDDCLLEMLTENKHKLTAELLRELKKDREILDGLSIYFQSLVVDAVINQRPLMFDMRDATKEERESVKQYISDSAKTTGVNFWSIIGEVKTDDE